MTVYELLHRLQGFPQHAQVAVEGMDLGTTDVSVALVERDELEPLVLFGLRHVVEPVLGAIEPEPPLGAVPDFSDNVITITPEVAKDAGSF